MLLPFMLLLRTTSAVRGSLISTPRRAAPVVRRACSLRAAAADPAAVATASAAGAGGRSAGEPFYITTPIYYVNGAPHIGHAYTSLACDVLARWMRLEGRDVFFLTGTDEHGQKVEQSAEKAGESPLAFADRVSASFRALAAAYDISNDDFIRTTEARHADAAQALWRKLAAKGDIYLGEYEGWYSVRDEAFYTEEELVDGRAPTGAPVEWVAESSYFFRLSRWREPLEAHIRANPEFISPPSRRNEVLSFMREGLRDLSISRTTFGWGIPVPDAEPGGARHIMYVWLDALANYLSAIGYPDEGGAPFRAYWPAAVHMVGKDILRFHAVYWPAFLLAAGLPLPRRLFAHGWWMSGGQKMSKSLGNVVDPIELVDAYGSDAVRYFLVNEVAFGGDGDFSRRKLVESVNARLANDLGNLAYRTLSFAHKHCDGAVPAAAGLIAADEEMLGAARGLLDEMRVHIDELALHRLTQSASAVTAAANRYIDAQAPWALRKTDPERMRTVLWVLLEAVRHVAVVSQPIVPKLAAALLDQLGVPADARDFDCLARPEGALRGGAPLPTPRIVVPRIEYDEPAEPATEAAPALDGAALAALEAEVRAQGEVVRELKAAGSDAGEAIGALLELKARLPDGHDLKGGKKKKKK